jgi:hypothetical protein
MRCQKGLLAALIVATACSSTQPSVQPTSRAVASPISSSPSDGASTPAVTSEPSPTMRGILVLYCGNDREGRLITVTPYDPVTGVPGEPRIFRPGSAATGVCPVLGTVPDPVRRNEFNADYTRLAATETGEDGGNHVGYVDAAGAFTDLTSDKGSGFGAVAPDQRSPVFHPKTGRMWFWDARIGSQLGSVDPEKGPNSSQRESLNGFRPSADTSRFDFSANGNTVINGSYGHQGVVTPNGDARVYSTVDQGWFLDASVGPDDEAAGGTPLTLEQDAPAPRCEPKTFIDATTFLCFGRGTVGQPSGLYSMTLKRSHLIQVPLLPKSDKEIRDAAPSPAAEQIAFIAVDTDTGAASLYVTGRGRQAEPKRLAEFSEPQAILRSVNTLISWE